MRSFIVNGHRVGVMWNGYRSFLCSCHGHPELTVEGCDTHKIAAKNYVAMPEAGFDRKTRLHPLDMVTEVV